MRWQTEEEDTNIHLPSWRKQEAAEECQGGGGWGLWERKKKTELLRFISAVLNTSCRTRLEKCYTVCFHDTYIYINICGSHSYKTHLEVVNYSFNENLDCHFLVQQESISKGRKEKLCVDIRKEYNQKSKVFARWIYWQALLEGSPRSDQRLIEYFNVYCNHSCVILQSWGLKTFKI